MSGGAGVIYAQDGDVGFASASECWTAEGQRTYFTLTDGRGTQMHGTTDSCPYDLSSL